MQAFYHGDWINPMKADITKIVNEAKKYARMPGVSGVHFDYLRFSELIIIKQKEELKK